jgi:hypothetical protein
MRTDVVMTTEQYYNTLLDAIPLPIFVVNDDVRIMDFNTAAYAFLEDARNLVLNRRGGEALHCFHANDVADGCGHGPQCGTCVLRNSVGEALKGKQTHRVKTKAKLMVKGSATDVDLLVTSAPIPGSDDRALMILEDVSELNNLRTLIPMCANCRRIRNDDQYWQSIETYFKKHLGVDVSHGLCQECVKKLYPEYSDQILKNHPLP